MDDDGTVMQEYHPGYNLYLYLLLPAATIPLFLACLWIWLCYRDDKVPQEMDHGGRIGTSTTIRASKLSPEELSNKYQEHRRSTLRHDQIAAAQVREADVTDDEYDSDNLSVPDRGEDSRVLVPGSPATQESLIAPRLQDMHKEGTAEEVTSPTSPSRGRPGTYDMDSEGGASRDTMDDKTPDIRSNNEEDAGGTDNEIEGLLDKFAKNMPSFAPPPEIENNRFTNKNQGPLTWFTRQESIAADRQAKRERATLRKAAAAQEKQRQATLRKAAAQEKRQQRQSVRNGRRPAAEAPANISRRTSAAAASQEQRQQQQQSLHGNLQSILSPKARAAAEQQSVLSPKARAAADQQSVFSPKARAAAEQQQQSILPPKSKTAKARRSNINNKIDKGQPVEGITSSSGQAVAWRQPTEDAAPPEAGREGGAGPRSVAKSE